MIDLNDAWSQVRLLDPGEMSGRTPPRIEARMRVHRWLVLTEVEPVLAHGRRKRRRWFCRCDCGNEKIVLQQSLSLALRSLHAGSRSCGCYQVERATKHANNTKGRPTSEYMTWIAAKKRCENPRNASYRNYGQRGIRMCAEWSESFEAFLRHMGHKPDPTFSLDRIDPNGHYEPGNCRWASSSVQARNKRTNAWYIFRDERMLIGDVAARMGVSRDEARAMEKRGTLPARRIGGAANEPVSSLHGDGIDLNDATILSSSFIIVDLEYSETVWAG